MLITIEELVIVVLIINEGKIWIPFLKEGKHKNSTFWRGQLRTLCGWASLPWAQLAFVRKQQLRGCPVYCAAHLCLGVLLGQGRFFSCTHAIPWKVWSLSKVMGKRRPPVRALSWFPVSVNGSVMVCRFLCGRCARQSSHLHFSLFMTFVSEPYKTTEFKHSHRMILFQPLKPQYFQQKVLM